MVLPAGYTPSSPPAAAVDPDDRSAVEQAELIRAYIEAGEDDKGVPLIYKYFGEPEVGQGTGFVGSPFERLTRKDIFSKKVERLLEPEYLSALERLYGSGEVGVPKEGAGILQSLVTSVMGRTPSESEREAEKIASERGGSGDFLARYFKEVMGYDPTTAELEGEAPEGASPVEKVLLSRYPYGPATGRVAQKVELEKYGRVPLKDPELFKEDVEKANKGLNWLTQLPMAEDESGKEYSVAEDIVGQILLADINAKFGTNEKQYTLEDLDLKIQPTAKGKQLVFNHPTEGRQPINPVTFDWGDVASVLPEAYLVLGDVIGSVVGGGGGSVAGPKGIFAGGLVGGVLGTMGAKFLVMNEALDKGGFVYDNSKLGFVSSKTGKQQVIPITSLLNEAGIEGLWSAGGTALGSTIFALGKAIFTRGGATAENFINKEDWDAAYRQWGESKLGQKLTERGIESPEYILERFARDLEEQAKNTTGAEADELIKRAKKIQAAASDFRSTLRVVDQEAIVPRERIANILEEETRNIGPGGKIIPQAKIEDATQFGDDLSKAVREGDGTRINALLDRASTDTAQHMLEFDAAFKGAGEGTEATFGQSIRNAAEKVLGEYGSKDPTTVYGRLNSIRGMMRANAQGWNLKEASDFVDKEIRILGPDFKGDLSAFPRSIQGTLMSLRDAAKAKGKAGIPANFEQVRRLSDQVAEEAGKATGQSARKLFKLQEILKNIEGKGIKNINPDIHKQWQNAMDDISTFHNIWKSHFERGLTELNPEKLADKFLSSIKNDQTVGQILKDFKGMGIYGKEQEDLLRNVLKTRLRSVLTRELKPDEGIEIAGAARNVTVGRSRFEAETVSGAQLRKFKNEYGPWIRQLFPDDPELDKFADTVSRGLDLQARYAKIGRIEQDLKKLPFLQKVSTTDLQKFATEEPHKLYDLIWQSGRSSVENTKSIKEVNRILKRGLEPYEYNLAQQRLKALTLQKIWDSGDEFAAASGRPISASEATEASLQFINRERTALAEVFGKNHVDNMRELFKEMNFAANPVNRGMAGMAEQYRKDPISSTAWSDLKKLPGLAAKVWVGVLNTKARALNLSSKLKASGDERAFFRLLSDAKALDKALKIRSGKAGRISANALGSALLVSSGDKVQDLLDNYTMTDDQGNRQPVPIQSREEAYEEALDRVLGP